MGIRNSTARLRQIVAVIQNDRYGLFKVLVTAVILIGFGVIFVPFFTEILMATLSALALAPAANKLSKMKPIYRKLTIGLSLAFLGLVLTGTLTLLAYKLTVIVGNISKSGLESSEIYKHMSTLKDNVQHWLDRFDFQIAAGGNISDELITKVGGFLLGLTTRFAMSVPSLVISTLVFSGCLYLFLTETETIRNRVRHLNLLKNQDATTLISMLQESSWSAIFSSLITGTAQATLVTIGSIVFQTGDPFLVFVITLLISFIPMVGAAPISVALALYAFASGATGHGIGLGITALITGVIDNIIRSTITRAKEKEIHPLIALFGVVGALMVFGLPGLFLGPMLLQLAYRIVPLFFGSAKRA